MRRPAISLLSICAELAGLAVLSLLVTLIAAFHVFDGFRMVEATTAVLFSIAASSLSLLALTGYALWRLSELRRHNLALYQAATRDGLTRVLNRAAFEQRAREMMATIGQRRTDPQSLTLLIVDADHFKRINDRLGHATGDKALISIARMLATSVRRDDVVGRLGGEEFAILLREASLEEGEIVAERLRANINRLSVGNGKMQTRLSVSIGGFAFNRQIPFALAYAQADANLYRAKKGGRNRFEVTALASYLRSQATTRLLTRATNAPPQGLRLRS